MKFKFLLSTLLGLGLLVGTNAIAADKRIAIGASNSQSAHYAYFASLAKVVNDAKVGLNLSLVETGAGVDNLKRFDRGQLDIGLITSNALYEAYNGKGIFKKPIKSKILWIYNLAAQNVIVRQDSGVKTIAELTGKKLGPGMRGSGTEQASEAVFKALGVKPEFVRGSNAEITDAVKDKRSIGIVQSSVGTGFNPLTTDLATFTPVYCLGLTAEEEAIIKKEVPELAVVEMPGGELMGRGPYKIWAFLIGTGAAPNLDDETAYKLTKLACENIAPQKASFGAGLISENLAEATLKYATTPLHPGAIKYYEEKGYTVPAHLKD